MSEEKKGSAPKRPSTKPRNKHKKERRSVPSLVKVTADFAACPRCSYFWAGYRVIAGEAAMQTAVEEALATHSHWLTLEWSHAMNELVHKSYGAQIEANYAHYEGRCRECYRLFVRSEQPPAETAVAELTEEGVAAEAEEALPSLTQPMPPVLIRGLHVDESLQTVVDEIATLFAADYPPMQLQIQLLRQN